MLSEHNHKTWNRLTKTTKEDHLIYFEEFTTQKQNSLREITTKINNFDKENH